MPRAGRHWTTVAREVAGRLAGLDKPSRVERLREEAGLLGIEAHTLRRYLVLLAFLDRIGVRDDDAARLPVGPLEVVLRIWNRDPSVAARALRMVRQGGLSFRGALAMERSVGVGRSETRELSEPAWETSGWLREQVALSLGLRPVDLVEVDQSEEPRVDLVRAHRLYKAEGRTVALLDEAAYAEVAGTSSVRELVRDALAASALFDEVVVMLAFSRSADVYSSYMGLAEPKRSGNVRSLETDRQRFDFEKVEG